MLYLFVFLSGLAFCEAALKEQPLKGWDYINLHCRDNDNAPVDWWMLYKPPKGKNEWEAGLNFSYISSAQAGKWIPSDRYLTGDSMLIHTLAPMFRLTYQDHLAVATYSSKPAVGGKPGSAAMGLLLADELSGVWIIHTVPGLVDTIGDRLHFPEDEMQYGHMIMCLSADFMTLNELARRLKEEDPNVMSVKVPPSIQQRLPHWQSFKEPMQLPLNTNVQSKTFEYSTRDKTLHAEVVIRRPGNRHCSYKRFAKSHSVVLDVYGHHRRAHDTICEKSYGIRKIDAISLNYPNQINNDAKHSQVVYVDSHYDRLEFAVSTAAHWQRRGGTVDPEYWACVGSTAADDAAGTGGLLFCVEDYNIWRSFDILKVKEPEC